MQVWFSLCLIKRRRWSRLVWHSNYARFESEDAKVVPYNRELLKAWDGHINVQRVTQLGLVRYLVKYVSKIEPTFTLSVKQNKTEVDKYFTTRLIGAPEVAKRAIFSICWRYQASFFLGYQFY